MSGEPRRLLALGLLTLWWLPALGSVVIALPAGHGEHGAAEAAHVHATRHADRPHAHGAAAHAGHHREAPEPRGDVLELVAALLHGHAHGASAPDHEHPAQRTVLVPLAPIMVPSAISAAAPGAADRACSPAAGSPVSPLPPRPLFVALCSYLL